MRLDRRLSWPICVYRWNISWVGWNWSWTTAQMYKTLTLQRRHCAIRSANAHAAICINRSQHLLTGASTTLSQSWWSKHSRSLHSPTFSLSPPNPSPHWPLLSIRTRPSFPFPPLPLEIGPPIWSSWGVWRSFVSSLKLPQRCRIWCILALKCDVWWQ